MKSPYPEVEKIGEEAKVLPERVFAHVIVENMQHTKKDDDAERRNKPPANPTIPLLRLSQLRDAYAHGQGRGIHKVGPKINKSLQQAEALDGIHITGEEMKQGIAQASGYERGREQSQARARFEVTHESRVEEKIDEHLFEIVDVAIPKFRNGTRLQRTPRISQSQETRHAARGDNLVSPDRNPE
jgi:hypothetical protein